MKEERVPGLVVTKNDSWYKDVGWSPGNELFLWWWYSDETAMDNLVYCNIWNCQVEQLGDELKPDDDW